MTLWGREKMKNMSPIFWVVSGDQTYGNLGEISGVGPRLQKGFSSVKDSLEWTTLVTETKQKCLSCEQDEDTKKTFIF